MENLVNYIDDDNTGVEIDGNSSSSSILFYEDMDRGLLAVESMITLHETMKLSDRPSADHINLFNIAVEQAYAIIDLHAPKSLSLESLTLTPRLAKESLLEDAKDAITAIGSKLGQFVKKSVDHMQYQLVLFDTQKKALHDLKQVLETKTTEVSKDFHVSVNNYMTFGNNQTPKNFDEYKREYIKTIDIMTSFLGACDKFQNDDFFQSWKVLISLVAGYDKKYNEMWDILFEFITTVEKAIDCKPYKSHETIRYKTDNLLGMSYIELTLPAPGTYDPKFTESKKGVHKHMDIRFNRVDKFGTGVLDSKLSLHGADKKALIEMCDASIKASEMVQKMYGFINRSSDLGAMWTGADFLLHAVFPLTWWHMLLASYRLMVKTSYLLLNNTASSFNFTRGNIDKFIRSTKKNISNA